MEPFDQPFAGLRATPALGIPVAPPLTSLGLWTEEGGPLPSWRLSRRTSTLDGDGLRSPTFSLWIRETACRSIISGKGRLMTGNMDIHCSRAVAAIGQA